MRMMVDKQLLNVIQQRIDARTALRSIDVLAGAATAHIERKMYYPYYSFTANCLVPTLFGKKEMTVNCLVDGVSGLGATAGAFSIEPETVSADDLLQLDVSAQEAERAARRTVSHQLSRKLRMIASFHMNIERQSIVYKGFWIIRSQDTLVMVDASSGGIHPLSSRAA
ncbi:MAG: hypothetical protein DRR11_08545 [Gammaproteobacteria bacterium]|nr:MAG: hypothetical protein DRR11_08545 [Gammaproteobacteria bacterium]